MKGNCIFWFRRDLRLHDNKALYHALNSGKSIIPIFIFDDNLIETLPVNDARVEFIHHALQKINEKLQPIGKSVLVQKGKPMEVIQSLVKKYNPTAVYCNADHEPYGIKRDLQIQRYLDSLGIVMHQHTDHLIFSKDEVLKPDGSSYAVFTPFSKKCKQNLTPSHLKQYPSENHLEAITSLSGKSHLPSLADLGFKKSGISFPEKDGKKEIIDKYDTTRDFPAMNGTTRLGVHLRFGTLSLRRLARYARNHNEVYFNELLWREFYAQILWWYPHVVTRSFKPQYDKIRWNDNREDFEKWKEGLTGYPLVDAGMRELKTTGYMHNRVRMVTASFLTKHLLIDWRWGEEWFAEQLLDYELSSNNGGWQWSAGSGCDAAPYFRIFNPLEQQKKFDPDKSYIKKWIPEIDTSDYPQPMVEHKFARERCLARYKEALQ